MEQTMEPVAQTTPAQSAVETPTPAGAPGSAPTPPKNRKKRKKTVRRIIAAVLVLAVGFTLFKKFGKKEGEAEIGTAIVDYGSITSMVNGSGMVKAKKSESITLATAGTVGDVFVTEGQKVAAGDPLFTYDSPDAEKKVREAKTNIEGYQKQLNAAYKDIAKLNLTAPYAGKLLETVKLTVGDEVGAQKVATLVDDTQMRLTQYYSYAYQSKLYAGQTVQVSVPALMSSIDGRVEKVHMVKRVTSEGSELFSVEIVVPNAGVLAKDMAASATVVVNGETVYPYEAGKLDYYRTSELSIPAGTVVATNLIDYLSVSAGEPLVQVNGENTENTIFDLEQSLQKAQKELEEAEKNAAYANAVAPIDGMVIGLSITPGQEITASATALTISDTELCSLLSNGLENALRAVKELPPERRTVSLYCGVQRNKLLIEITNPCGEAVTMRDGLPVSDRGAGHGFGCLSIQTIARRNGGLCEFSCGGGQFRLQVMLPVLEHRG